MLRHKAPAFWLTFILSFSPISSAQEPKNQLPTQNTVPSYGIAYQIGGGITFVLAIFTYRFYVFGLNSLCIHEASS